MMKRIIITLISFLVFGIIASIGFSAFTFLGEDVIFDYQDENNNPTGLSYVTFDYCDANMTDDYKYYFDSNTVFKESRIPLPNVNNSTHKFQGWYTDRQGNTPLNFSNHTFVNGERFYAKYMNTNISALNGSSDINIYDGSPSSNPMFFSSYNTLNAMTITKKIDIRYSSSGTYNSDTSGTTSATAYKYPNDAKMRIILDCDINIANGGVLQLSSVLGFTAGTSYNGIISNDNYTAIDLNGYTITIQSGGKFNAYGIIFNSKKTGGIIVENGGEMTTIFCMADFKGGTNLCGSYQKALMPFASYSCPYWFCETLFCSGSYLKGETSLCADSTKYSTTATLIGPDNSALVQLTSGYIIRSGMDFEYFLNRTVDYGNITNINALLTSAFRIKYIFTNSLDGKLGQLNASLSNASNCTIVLNSLAMRVQVPLVGNVNAEMTYGDFPIPPHFDIEAYSASITLSMSIVAMPSSNIMIDHNSSIVFTTKTVSSYTLYGRLTVIDEFPKDYYYLNANNARASGSYYINARMINSTVPGFVDMQGTFSFATSNVVTSSDYQKYSIGGKIKLSEQALHSLENNQDYVSLQSRFFFFNSCAYSSGLTKKFFGAAARYYFAPIVSEEKVYFQLSGNEILEGELYDFNNGLIKYNNKIYFMYYTNRTNTTTVWSLSTNTNPPTQSEQNNKYNNTLGVFAEATSVNYAVDNEYGKHGLYITYNGNNYCYVNGAYIQANPTTGANTVTKITGITSGEKFQITSDSNISASYKCATALTYEYKTERWLWSA